MPSDIKLPDICTQSASPSEPAIRIGTAGWSIPRQHATSFPGGSSHLERYSSALACAEINSSFYRPHRASTYARWAASTPERFRFSVKAPKAITHECGLAPSPQQLQDFFNAVRHLGSKLGPILFQLPPRQDFEEHRARQFFAMFRDLNPEGYVAVEPRHRAWFSGEVSRLLEEFRVARVVADPPPTPEAAHPGGYSKLIYYRLHGSPHVYYSSYSVTWLKQLAITLSGLQRTSETWCIFDNTASGAALENALSLTTDLTATQSPV